MSKPKMSGRLWAYVGAVLGGVVSIAANVAHSYVPPAGVTVDWSPPGGAVVGAIFWPVALFVAVEILARIDWPTGHRWAVLRFGGLVPVAGVAAFVSYRHLAGLLAFYGEDGLTAVLGPLAVDGLMVMATGALLATAPRPVPVAVPAESAAPAVAETSTQEPPEAAPPATEPAPAAPVKKTPVKRVTPRPASAVKVAKVAAKMPGAPVAQIAAKAGVSPSTARRHLAALNTTNASPTTPQPAQTPALTAA